MAAQQTSEPRAAAALSPAQRIERLVVIVAFLGLSLTGLPQRYSTEDWAHTLFVIGGGIESMRILHRFFAVLLMAEVVYHVLAIAYRWFVRGQGPVMLPRLRDFGAFLGQILSNLGLRREDERASTFHFVLRIEYLVLAISALILIITGLMLWMPIRVTAVLPGSTIPVARIMHSDQALLTILIIVLLRLAIALLWRPKRADIFAEALPPDMPPDRVRSRSRVFLPIAVIIAAAAAIAFGAFVTGEQTAITTVPRRQAVIYAPQTIPTSGDPEIGLLLWETLRCGFCHGANAQGGTRGEPALRPAEVTYTAFYEQVRIGRGDMPAFSTSELPDGYLVHLWAWLDQPAEGN